MGTYSSKSTTTLVTTWWCRSDMTGTYAGGIKARDKNLARDPDHYKKMGAKGGRNGHTGGFAANPELARIAGRQGALKAWTPERRQAHSELMRQYWEKRRKQGDTWNQKSASSSSTTSSSNTGRPSRKSESQSASSETSGRRVNAFVRWLFGDKR